MKVKIIVGVKDFGADDVTVAYKEIINYIPNSNFEIPETIKPLNGEKIY
jgi:hypothetical protein